MNTPITLPLINVNDQSQNKKIKKSNKNKGILCILVIILSFFGGYTFSRYFNIEEIDNFLLERELQNNYIEFDVLFDSEELSILISNISTSHEITHSEYILNDLIVNEFNITENQDTLIKIPKTDYPSLNFGENQTNIINIRITNSKNYRVIRTITFNIRIY